MRTVIFIALALFGATLVGQEIEYERFLLPVITPTPIPGAYGSLWTTHLTVINEADQPVRTNAFDICNFECPDVLIPPGVTFYPRRSAYSPHGGSLGQIERAFADRVRILLRAQDLSRDNESWGTRIPVVRESEFFSETVSLLDIPTSRDFRMLLRVYDLESSNPGTVTVRIYRTPTTSTTPWASRDFLLTEKALVLQNSSRSRFQPGYAELNLSNIPELTGPERVRVQVEPATAGMRFWAFVTVTHNATQHVTIIAAD